MMNERFVAVNVVRWFRYMYTMLIIMNNSDNEGQ